MRVMGTMNRTKAVTNFLGPKMLSPPAFQSAPPGARPRSSLFCLLFVLALTMCTRLGSSALFEDASAESDFGSDLLLSTPWSGLASIARLIDLDSDGVDEMLIGGSQFACSGRIDQLSLFVLDPSSNRYVQRDYGRDRTFLGLNFSTFFFELLRRMGSVLPDIVACWVPANRLAVLSNHGALNFSISSNVAAANIYCYNYATALAVSDSDHDGHDNLFVSSGYGTSFWSYLPNGTLVSAASSFPSLPILSSPSATFSDLDGDSYTDLVWTGLLSPDFPMFIFHNIGENFSAVPNSIAGVTSGSLAVAEFTGDANADIVVSGRLANGSRMATHYAQNGSISFVRRDDFMYNTTTPCSVAAVPLRSQTSALDLVLTSNPSYTSYAPTIVLLNNGNGSFSNIVAPWMPSAFKGFVSRGPDIGTSQIGRAHV